MSDCLVAAPHFSTLKMVWSINHTSLTFVTVHFIFFLFRTVIYLLRFWYDMFQN